MKKHWKETMGVIALTAGTFMAPSGAGAAVPVGKPMPQASGGREGTMEHRGSGTGTDVMGHPSGTTGGVTGGTDARDAGRMRDGTNTGMGTGTGMSRRPILRAATSCRAPSPEPSRPHGRSTFMHGSCFCVNIA